ncbi:MAG: DUF1549 domain-containing protein [Planctomycetaceae bacterium]
MSVELGSVSYRSRVVRRSAGVLAVALFLGVSPPGVLATDEPPAAIDFERDIQPILTRFGCNSGPCHGKQRGQNGFQLSLLGFDSEFDHAALTKEAQGRRVRVAQPEQSLLLRKATGLLPHGGGVRLRPDGEEAKLLLDWIRQGAARKVPGTPSLVRVDVSPMDQQLAGGDGFALKVTAHYSDGSTRDVTGLSTYQSNEAPIASVDESGRIESTGVVGEAAILARYGGEFAICNVSVPREGRMPSEYYARLPRNNDIDDYVWQGLERLGLTASEPAPETKFLRRVYIDIIGRVPTVDEARAFLDSHDASKREVLVDRLLASPEYAEHWANKWADLLRPNPFRVGIKAVFNYDAWIRQAFRQNMPYDQFARALLTGQGSTFRDGQVTLFRDRREPDELATLVSQLFLGIRLECAKCHHHPFEVYGQEDFYSFAAYFAKVGRKGTGLSPPISGSEEFVFAGTKGEVRHPLTNEVLAPRPLFGDAAAIEVGADPRRVLADWITSPANPYFAQTMANRIWTDLMGRGLVEPVDDLRATNPPVNAPLLTALGRDFAAQGYDIQQLIKRIVLSHAYSLSSVPTKENVVETRSYSRHYRQRLRAEVLYDSVLRITGAEGKFEAMPPETDARQLWTHRINSLFLDAFGRPDPNQDPPCERMSDSTVVQTLHLMNSDQLAEAITGDAGRAAKLAASDRSPAQIVEELYLSVYSRRPTEKELNIGAGLYENEGVTRRQATEDLLWALLNTPEFLFKD